MRVAVLGATGAVGRTMLRALEASPLDVREIRPLASPRSRGATIRWKGAEWTVAVPEPGAFQGCDLALFSAGAERSREWAPRAAEEGAIVIDNSSAWRMDPDVPLVVPEVNAHRLAQTRARIIANPNCVTIQLVVVLEALRRAAGLERVVVSTYQAVSGAGQAGLDALRSELAGAPPPPAPFPAAIAGNVIPRIGDVEADGWTGEERKIRQETRKILELPGLPVAATCVRVPVEVGHAVAATIHTARPLTVAEARAALAAMHGVEVDEGATGPLPRDVAGRDAVRVGRIRLDPDLPAVLHVWIAADNLRKGAAVNAVQIAERVLHG